MDITPAIPAGRQVVEAYGGAGFRITRQRHDGSVLVFPVETLAWPVGSISDLTSVHLQPILDRAADIEVLLLGCGASIAFLKPDLRALLKEQGIVVDLMDTGAACRTYNVLLAEDRRVAAALIAVD
ncbi:MAG: MTH938/NDUFAF3 family protein [Minwuia sp.]|nr:MTH938/NDUFAF3 family protein [Minwuia sp.]